MEGKKIPIILKCVSISFYIFLPLRHNTCLHYIHIYFAYMCIPPRSIIVYNRIPITSAKVYLLFKAISRNSCFRAQYHLKIIDVPHAFMTQKARPPPTNVASYKHGVHRKGDRARKILPLVVVHGQAFVIHTFPNKLHRPQT